MSGRIWLLCVFFLLSACAHTTRVQTQVTATRERTFVAVTRALVSSGFQITHTDTVVGAISVERPIKQFLTGREGGGGGGMRLTVLVSETPTGSRLDIVWTPPGRALGTFTGEQADFLSHLRTELPGVKIE